MDKDVRKHIDSIQGLKGLAFLGVFFSHTGHPFFQGSGAWAVSLFFCISGFLCIYKKQNSMEETEKPTFKYCLGYLKYRIGKLYVLHIITTVISLPLLFLGEGVSNIENVVVALFSNLLLVQEWIPLSLRSINGVSWYLCVLAFLLFMTPILLSIFRRRMTIKSAAITLGGLIFLQILISFFAGMIPYGLANNPWIENDFTHWIVYQFPLVRLADYVEGMCVGFLFLRTRVFDRTINNSVAEIGIFLAVILSNVLFNYIAQRTYSFNERPERWFIYVDIFTLFNSAFVFLIAKGKGIISNLLKTRVFMYLGHISAYAFLIHMVIIRYTSGIASILGLSETVIFLLKFSFCFVVSLIFSQLWSVIYNRKTNTIKRNRI